MFLTREIILSERRKFLSMWSVSFPGSTTFRHVSLLKHCFSYGRAFWRVSEREREGGGILRNRKNKISRMPSIRLMLACYILVSWALAFLLPPRCAYPRSSSSCLRRGASLRASASKRKPGV